MAERVAARVVPAAASRPVAPRLGQVNVSLFLGIALVGLVLFIAIAGPRIAPHDPMNENVVLRVGEQWFPAPFAPFAVPGYPLGSDNLGRDLVSRLLWAVRPTMTVVAMAAAIRLILGTAIGLVAGWSTRWPGRVLDTTMAAALAIPALMVALAFVAVTQAKLGMWAFVFGLALTGWAESARLVREQTRAIKGNIYIEAARALGGSDPHIIGKHVLRQILPLLWILFSFEISSTLLTLAGLGFLGYFVGGEIWVPISDFVAARFSGAPELGQMLQTDSGELFEGPWKIFATGGMVFLIILAFNLLGEGLRVQFQREQHRRTIFSGVADRLSEWVGDTILPPLTSGSRARGAVLAGILLIALLGGGWMWRQSQPGDTPAAPAVAMPVPGDHPWASQWGNPYGTRWTEAAGPENPAVRHTFTAPGGLAGGPVIAADGTLYIAASGGTLHALDGELAPLWEAPLPAPPVGAPALGEERLYIADRSGGLAALTLAGELIWHFTVEESLPAGAGPTVAPDGTIYYTVGSGIQAVSADGESLWRQNAVIAPVYDPPQLSPTDDIIVLERGVLHRDDGSRLDSSTLADLRPLQFYIGADGRNYFRHSNMVTAWRPAEGDIELLEQGEWDQRQYAGTIPRDAGVTRSGVAWMIAWNPFQDAKMVWLDMTISKMIGSVIYPHRPSNMLAVDRNNIMYLCGFSQIRGPECLGYRIGGATPNWQLALPQGGTVNGGALVEGRLYVSTAEGTLYGIAQ